MKGLILLCSYFLLGVGSGATVSGDGGPATSAVVYSPLRIFVDTTSVMYVSQSKYSESLIACTLCFFRYSRRT